MMMGNEVSMSVKEEERVFEMRIKNEMRMKNEIRQMIGLWKARKKKLGEEGSRDCHV
jgi:hypothetical protein